MRPLALAVLLCAAPASGARFEKLVEAASFRRAALHAHTNASDGDAAPAAVARWYAERGYALLALTDHDALTKTKAPYGLTLIPGVELTSWSRTEKKPVHVNALCARKPAAGIRAEAPVADLLARTLARAKAAGGLALVNHPTFGAALSSAVLLGAPPFELLEIASAHPLVPLGPAEEMWTALLDAGREVFAVAVDDAHDFVSEGERRRPGGAWVAVWGREPCADLRAGQFYASTGPALSRLSVGENALELAVEAFPKEARVEFVGAGGRILKTADASPARYALKGGEAYVRARVVFPDGGRAWTQAYRAR